MGPLMYTTATTNCTTTTPNPTTNIDIDSHDEDSDDEEEEDLEGFFLGIEQTTKNRIPYGLTVEPQTFNIFKDSSDRFQ